MACIERIFDSGSGATEYILSEGNQNRQTMSTLPDSEGCSCDGQVSGSDFQAQSQGPDRAQF